jgi:hypothetical protein
MLEDNQVLVQGMMANRYMDTFRNAITAWNRRLMAVADVVQVGERWLYCLMSELAWPVKHGP